MLITIILLGVASDWTISEIEATPLDNNNK